MDRLKREANPPVGQLASPIPQYKRPGSTDYEAVEGQHGAPFATLKDANGNVVSPATEDKLEQVRQLLAGVATEAKLEQARVLLNSINSKDFATASKQDALNTVVEDLKSELVLVKTELETIKANQISGDQKVTLSGTITEMRDVWQATVTAGSTGFLKPVVKTPAPPFVIIVRTQQMISHDWGVTWRYRGEGDVSYIPRLYRDGTYTTFSVNTTGEGKYNTVALVVNALGATHFNLRFKNNEEFDVDVSVDIIKW